MVIKKGQRISILIKFMVLDGNCCSWKFSFYVSIFRRFLKSLFG